jgi:chromosome segregation ATPase
MERKEPTLSSSGASVPERDLAGRRPTAAEPRPSRPASGSTLTQSPVRTVPSSSSPLALIALVLALIGVGLGGFFGWKLTQAQAQLQQADGRIADLEGKLSMTSDQSSQSLTQVDAKLKWVDSEIRKLWGVSNDTNRKAIAANKDNIANLEKSLAAAKKDASTAKTSAAALTGQLTENKAALDNSVARVEEAVKGIAEQRKRLQDFTEQVDRVEGRLANLSTLEDKVRTNEEAIAAIDAYRRSINRDLLQIKQNMAPAGTP